MLMRPNWFPRPGTIPAPNALLDPAGRRQALATRKSCLLPNSATGPKISAGAVARLRAAPVHRLSVSPSPRQLGSCRATPSLHPTSLLPALPRATNPPMLQP